jgi:amino acid adenylation domain-containing protein
MQIPSDRKAKLSAAKQSLLEKRLQGKAVTTGSIPAITRTVDGEHGPLSYAQQRLWFIDQLEPGSTAYNMVFALRFEGRLNKKALGDAMHEIVRRHAILRTCFVEQNGRVMQQISTHSFPVVEEMDLRGFPEPAREAQATNLVSSEASKSFSLKEAPLLRLKLLQLDEQNHVLVVVMHHIISDGWSTSVIVQEFAALYEAYSNGGSSPLTELKIQYADFAAWQRHWLQGEILERQVDYWRRQLAGLQTLQLSIPRKRAGKAQHRGTRAQIEISRDLKEKLNALSKWAGGTLFMTMLAAFNVLLSRYSGESDIAVGTPIANRKQVETEALVGFFVNMLVLRSNLEGDPTFVELIERTKQMTLEAYSHQDAPFEKLVEELRPERQLSRTPLFQVLFVMQNTPKPDLELAGVKITPMDVEVEAGFDLTMTVGQNKNGFTTALVYNTDLFDEATIEQMLGHWKTLLESATNNPNERISQLNILTQVERQQMAPQVPVSFYEPYGCITQLFEQQVERTPDATAVEYGAEQFTYKELNRRANQLAHYLQQLGAGPEVHIGLCLERSLEMVVAILGVLKAGAVYVPMDPRYPENRLQYMLEDAGAKLALTTAETSERLEQWPGRQLKLDSDWDDVAAQPVHNLALKIDRKNAAYIIYTSGSTGLPKGVVVTHHNVVRLFKSSEPLFEFCAKDVWTLFHSYAFDFSVWEIWGALLYGGRLVVVPYWITRAPEDFYELVRTRKVTILNQTPSAFQQLIKAEEARGAQGAGLELRHVIFGGEVLDFAGLQSWFSRHGDAKPQLINMYGITETTVHVTLFPIRSVGASEGGSRIGKALADLQAYVLDSQMGLLPAGVAGELYVGGAGLARGYLNRADFTAARFVPNPYSGVPGSRLYRTGDQGRWFPDGSLEFLGRLDHQVKIRGFRVELGEIEAAIVQYAGVRECIVVAREDQIGDRKIVAYIAGDAELAQLGGQLRADAQRRLPEYMVPANFVFLESFPLTPQGKIDRAALPVPNQERPSSENSFVAPRTPVEMSLAAIWQDILGVQRVGAYDSFFDLGGHSLSLIQLSARIRTAFEVEVPIRVLFDSPTLAGMTVAIAAAGIENENAAEMSQVIDELAQMSPEDIRALLQNEAS